jgi:hypothetical protein
MQSPKYMFVFAVPDRRQTQQHWNHTSRRCLKLFRKNWQETGVIIDRLYNGTRYI